MIVAAALCSGYSLSRWLHLEHRPFRPYSQMQGQWIQAPPDGGMDVYNGIFRRDFRLPGHVRNAWMSIAACHGFELTVNGRSIGWQHMWRPTRPYQTALSERGQWVNWPKVAMALNFAREYQWTDHQNHLLPVFIDLTPYLTRGPNVIGVEIESRQAPAKVRFDGAVTLWSGQVISLASDTHWQAETNPPYFQKIDWRLPAYRTHAWRQALRADPPPEQPLRAFDPRIYATPFSGRWMRHPQASAQDSVWFSTQWEIDQPPDEAWLRLVTNRNFELFINGQRRQLEVPDVRGLETGEWIYGHQRAANRMLHVEQLYTDDVAEDFVARHYTGPLQEPAGVDRNRFKTIDRLAPRPQNKDDRSRSLEPPKPLMLRRDQAIGAYVGYSLTGLLRKGTNTITVRLNRTATSNSANWPGQLAVDGEITFHDGSRQSLTSGSHWQTHKLGTAADSTAVPARAMGNVLRAGHALTQFQYRGAPLTRDFLPPWLVPAALASGASLVAFGSLLAWGALAPSPTPMGRTRRQRRRLIADLTTVLCAALLPLTVLLASVIVIEASFGERSELLWLSMPGIWKWSLAAAVALGVLSGGVSALRFAGGVGGALAAVSSALANLPRTRLWTFAVIWLCLLTFFLRAYRVDFQPLDYDENPSLQAILEISRTGIPSYVPEAVSYTRSPLFHYITAGVVWLFGENLWAVRLPTAVFSAATSLLVYFCGSRLLGRPWIGMAAMLLTLIHPQMFMTGHMIRFYQQQQCFALLTAYWFCKGFVNEQLQRYRYLTVAAFLAATLSQEITAVVGVPLFVGYLFFAARKPLSEDIKLLAAVACAMVVIIIDFLIYKTLTLTRLEGFSTIMQADVGPHLWEPYNFLTVFLSYSRLHLPLTLMFFLGLPAVFAERNRAVLALHVIFLGGILMLNLMITQVSARYVYWLFPLLFLLALDNARAGLAWLDRAMHGQSSAAAARRMRFAAGVSFGILVLGVAISWSPWRLPGTYDTKLLADSNGALQYIRSQLRPGDKIIVTQPHAQGALHEIGRVDYELHVPLLYDFVLLENGRLVERAAAAEVICTLSQFQKLCAKHDRLWIAIDREKYPFRGERIREDHACARIESFLRTNMQLKHRTHMWHVYLWDADHGRFRAFRSHSS
jgi:4-amino-4-deoxy-L-arabinose transferase-like glycosyltransferase